jgi:ankyrin repeat protein
MPVHLYAWVTLQFDDTSLMRAAYRGNLDIVKILVEGGADPDAVNTVTWTAVLPPWQSLLLQVPPLCFQHRLSECVSHRACVQRGKKALDIARQKGFKDIEEYLFPITEPRGKLLVSIQRPPRPYNVM